MAGLAGHKINASHSDRTRKVTQVSTCGEFGVDHQRASSLPPDLKLIRSFFFIFPKN
jgi:hypothetical protein